MRTWYVLIKLDGEWYYLADPNKSNLLGTKYIMSAKQFYSQEAAITERKKQIRLGYQAKTYSVKG